MSEVLDRGRKVIQAEADAIRSLGSRLDSRFEDAVEALLSCRGRVITTGVGKAGIVAHKMAATLASTGTPALFLHPAEAVHGDLGVVGAQDIVIVFSYSGESDEVVRLLPSIKRIGACIIALVGNSRSTLAQSAGIVLDVSVDAEACPLGLAPTTSVAAMLALGDALALAAMEARGFTQEDFAAFHPAGALGRRLTLRVSDVMRRGEQLAVVQESATLHDAILAITAARAGAACVVDDEGALTGIFTDGDFRRAIQQDEFASRAAVSQYMTRTPMVITGDPLAAEAMSAMLEWPRAQIGEAPVVDANGRPVGMIMIKDLLRAGL